MSSRESILAGVSANQPQGTALPDIDRFIKGPENALAKFSEVLTAIGGTVHPVASYAEILSAVKRRYDATDRIMAFVPGLDELNTIPHQENDHPTELANVELAIIKAHFGVAENGAVWVTDDLMGIRVLPFICQHLAAVISETEIIATMHDAYQRIGDGKYDFGTFIAGPSKTADIEQSLVLGAHGPRSMTVFVLLNNN